MALKKTAHTQAAEQVAQVLDTVIKGFRDEPRFMQKFSDRTEKLHERHDAAAIDIQELRRSLNQKTIEKLIRMDEEHDGG